jgi:aryl-alcohol dehydrogenase-like predicted oxidoreductase
MILGLGTAQFGSDYGISNGGGKVANTEVERILRLAAESGVTALDTAPVYGESETSLGDLLWKGHPFRIITKVSAHRTGVIGREDAANLRDTFMRSLERLRQDSVHGLLLHQAADLSKPGGGLLIEALIRLKREGLVDRVGASFYSAGEIQEASARMPLDIAQLPVNLLDQRLVSDGSLAELRARGVEIHVRSVFLQGLLLVDPDRMPAHFAPHRPVFGRIRSYASHAKLSAVALALAFARQLPQIDTVLIGVTSTAELREIVRASTEDIPPVDFAQFATTDEAILNPSLWPLQTRISNA